MEKRIVWRESFEKIRKDSFEQILSEEILSRSREFRDRPRDFSVSSKFLAINVVDLKLGRTTTLANESRYPLDSVWRTSDPTTPGPKSMLRKTIWPIRMVCKAFFREHETLCSFSIIRVRDSAEPVPPSSPGNCHTRSAPFSAALVVTNKQFWTISNSFSNGIHLLGEYLGCQSVIPTRYSSGLVAETCKLLGPSLFTLKLSNELSCFLAKSPAIWLVGNYPRNGRFD